MQMPSLEIMFGKSSSYIYLNIYRCTYIGRDFSQKIIYKIGINIANSFFWNGAYHVFEKSSSWVESKLDALVFKWWCFIHNAGLNKQIYILAISKVILGWHRLLTMSAYGDFIVLAHWETRTLAPWSNFLLSHIILILTYLVLLSTSEATTSVTLVSHWFNSTKGVTWWVIDWLVVSLRRVPGDCSYKDILFCYLPWFFACTLMLTTLYRSTITYPNYLGDSCVCYKLFTFQNKCSN